MVAGLKKIDPFVAHPKHQTMLLRNTSRPAAGEQVAERFRLARAVERVAQHRFDQIEYSDCGIPIGFDPITKIVPELGVENRSSLNFPRHRGCLAAISQRSTPERCLARLDEAQSVNDGHSGATGASEPSQ
jgi:hypothetical protein